MIRRDQAYWARLRKDSRSALAVGFVLLTCFAALLGALGLIFDGAPSQTRANPLYWLILLPFAWWASGLIAYEPQPVRMMKPVLGMAVLASMISLALALKLGREPMLWIVSAAVAAIGAVSSEVLYRGSMLQREGPAR